VKATHANPQDAGPARCGRCQATAAEDERFFPYGPSHGILTHPVHTVRALRRRERNVQPYQIGSNDIARSKKFYDALFTAMGAEPATEDARGRLAYSHNGGRFMVTKPIDGSKATHANGGTIGFQMKDAAQAEAWHKAGVANGGTSIEDPPGVRANGAYLAYLRDPDGNKLVAVARPAA
jgi:predicted enzyme related to lactoylglutathione lyase